MRPRLRFTIRALADVQSIGDHIAVGGNPARARTFTQELRTRCDRIVDLPEAAPSRPEYGTGVRVAPFAGPRSSTVGRPSAGW